MEAELILNITSIIILIFVYLSSQKTKEKYIEWDNDEDLKDIRQMTAKLNKMKEEDKTALYETNPEFYEKLFAAIKQHKINDAVFRSYFWIGVNSFVVSLGFGVITYFMKITSLPGVLFGLLISSPRVLLISVTKFNSIFRSK